MAMKLCLEVIDGPKKGEKFIIKEGFKIGRINQDISLDDPKVSTHHADIIVNSRGFLVLSDNNSRNGILVGGKLRKKTTLRVGKIIKIGNSLLEVKQAKDTDKLAVEVFNPDNEITRVPGQKLPATETPEEDAFERVLTWNEELTNNMKAFGKKIKNQKTSLAGFKEDIHLKIIKGIQMGTEWTISYGPRKFGADSLEFPIYDQEAPTVCFEIIPKNEGPQFKTSHPNKVLLNDKSTENQILKDKDRISVGTLIIEVSF